MKTFPKTYYISQGNTPEDHISNIENVCKAGCKIVQLRLKNVSDKIYLSTALKIKNICSTYNVTFIVNDNLQIAISSKADGLHLGKTDLSISEAKKLFPNKIIGGTANTLSDCLALINQGVDYIGLGPFQFTDTKKELNPILGLEGYKDIITKLKTLKQNTPIIAIGGIKTTDFNQLFNIGISSVALSALLTNKKEQELKHIILNTSLT